MSIYARWGLSPSLNDYDFKRSIASRQILSLRIVPQLDRFICSDTQQQLSRIYQKEHLLFFVKITIVHLITFFSLKKPFGLVI